MHHRLQICSSRSKHDMPYFARFYHILISISTTSLNTQLNVCIILAAKTLMTSLLKYKHMYLLRVCSTPCCRYKDHAANQYEYARETIHRAKRGKSTRNLRHSSLLHYCRKLIYSALLQMLQLMPENGKCLTIYSRC